jgi:LysM repeat protein
VFAATNRGEALPEINGDERHHLPSCSLHRAGFVVPMTLDQLSGGRRLRPLRPPASLKMTCTEKTSAPWPEGALAACVVRFQGSGEPGRGTDTALRRGSEHAGRDGDDVDVLRAGESLGIGQKLTSSNGKYILIMQGDGNLVLYTESNTPVWSTRTQGRGAVRASLQDDGNLVLYTKEEERRFRRDVAAAVWASQTRGENVRLILQDDRNLVIYTADGRELWASGTALAGGAEAPPTEAPTAPAPAPAAPPEAPAAPPPPPARRTYTVVSGDTLWAIAERFYGDGSKYPQIASANGIANPDLIMVGQQLTIPE